MFSRLRLPTLFALAIFLGAPALASDPLNAFEQYLVDTSGIATEVYARDQIILVWPKGFQPATWAPTLKVENAGQMATLLDTAYAIYADWFQHDPNEFLRQPGKPRVRLVLRPGKTEREGHVEWEGDFRFPQPWGTETSVIRPYIGLRDPFRSEVGSEGWFGWLLHEMAHDFLHLKPLGMSPGYGEGFCDFARYQALRHFQIEDEARANRAAYESNAFDGYHTPAGLLISTFEAGPYKTVRDFIAKMRQTRFSRTVGPAYWDFLETSGYAAHALSTQENFLRRYQALRNKLAIPTFPVARALDQLHEGLAAIDEIQTGLHLLEAGSSSTRPYADYEIRHSFYPLQILRQRIRRLGQRLQVGVYQSDLAFAQLRTQQISGDLVRNARSEMRQLARELFREALPSSKPSYLAVLREALQESASLFPLSPPELRHEIALRALAHLSSREVAPYRAALEFQMTEALKAPDISLQFFHLMAEGLLTAHPDHTAYQELQNNLSARATESSPQRLRFLMRLARLRAGVSGERLTLYLFQRSLIEVHRDWFALLEQKPSEHLNTVMDLLSYPEIPETLVDFLIEDIASLQELSSEDWERALERAQNFDHLERPQLQALLKALTRPKGK
jgi:hypothetical protein